MLLSLLRKIELPDVEFIFNLGDWPLEDNFENPLPIFGWCGSTEQTDIPLPTWDQTKNSRHALFRKLVFLSTDKTMQQIPFIDYAFI